MSRRRRSPTAAGASSRRPPRCSHAGCARSSPSDDLHVESLVLPRVVAPPASRRCDDDAQHVGIAVRRPQREAVQADKDQNPGPERVEEIERSRAHQQRKEEQAAIDATDRKWPVHRFVHGAIYRLIRHHALRRDPRSIRTATRGTGPRTAPSRRRIRFRRVVASRPSRRT